MQNRIQKTMAALAETNRKALIPYVVAGDPDLKSTLEIMHAMVDSGADIIELGVPFSDPMAEGPTIALGHERALAAKTSLRKILELVAQFRQSNNETPIVLMGYANPVERFGYESFAESASQAGVDGLLTVDLPPEECEQLNSHLQEKGIETVFLVAPTTTEERIKSIAQRASGYIYYVSLKGVTGAANLDSEGVNARLTEIRNITSLPLCVGFGIKDGVTARSVSEKADGVVVGSVLVDAIGKADSTAGAVKAVSDILSEIRAAIA